MPWHIEQDRPGCSGWAVVKDADSSVAGCHDTQADAQSQLAALYASEPEMEAAAMQPENPSILPVDPQVTQAEFDLAEPGDGPVSLDNPGASSQDYAALFPVPTVSDGTPCYGVAAVEGIPDGADPKRVWAPGSLTFAPLPWSLKWQVEEEENHEGSVVAGRVDMAWRDGALIRWVGVMDSAGVNGREAERLIAGQFVRGISIKADDVVETEIEYVYPAPNPQGMVEVDGEPTAAPAEGEPVADQVPMLEIEPPAMPELCIYHHGRIRSLTIVAEPAYVEATISLGISPFQPIAAPEASPLADLEAAMSADDAAAAQALEPVTVAAGYTITIPEVWPEWWFAEPSPAEMAGLTAGAVTITPEGRVYGLLAPGGVNHRGFRASGETVTAPRGIDYSEWQNKACIVAGADGMAYRINAGTVTFGCGHASPFDPRRANPAFAAEHYDNSCSVAMRARCGENAYGTWFAGGLAHGLTAADFEAIMGCALSGDWQGGKLKGALLVPVEGFPHAVTASVREKMGSLVASTVPIYFEEPPPPPDLEPVWALIAAATGRGPAARFAELADERFAEIAEGVK